MVVTLSPMRREKEIEFNLTDGGGFDVVANETRKGDRVQFDGRGGFNGVANET